MIFLGGFESGVEGRRFFSEGGGLFIGGRSVGVHIDVILLMNEDQLAEVFLVADLLQINTEVDAKSLVVFLSQDENEFFRVPSKPNRSRGINRDKAAILRGAIGLFNKNKLRLTTNHLILLHLNLRINLQYLKTHVLLEVRIQHLHLIKHRLHVRLPFPQTQPHLARLPPS